MESFLPEFKKIHIQGSSCHRFSFKLPVSALEFDRNITLDIVMECTCRPSSRGMNCLNASIWAKEPIEGFGKHLITIDLMFQQEIALEEQAERLYYVLRQDHEFYKKLTEFITVLKFVRRMDNPECPEFVVISFGSNRPLIYKTVAETYQIKTVCYPGSGDDIFPSLYIPNAIYIDSFSLVNDFFQQREQIQRYLDRNKLYNAPCTFSFYYQDYQSALNIPQVDLLISHCAGNVGHLMKPYLRLGGILLVTDLGEDAELALKDPDYELIGTICIYDKTLAEIVPGFQQPDRFVSPDSAYMQGFPMDRNLCFRKVRDRFTGESSL